MSDPRPEDQRAQRRAQLADDIATRLARVCGHLPDDAFHDLVRGIADLTLKYEEREYGSAFDGGGAPRRDD